MALITPQGLEHQQREHDRTLGGLHTFPYGALGGRWAPPVRELARRHNAQTILDYGAGKAGLALALGDEFHVRSYDPVTFPRTPDPADLVVCTDVLPHVEPDCVDDVLGHLVSLTRKVVFVVVPQHPAEKVKICGLLPLPLDEWLQLLSRRWPRFSAKVRRFRNPTPRLWFTGYV